MACAALLEGVGGDQWNGNLRTSSTMSESAFEKCERNVEPGSRSFFSFVRHGVLMDISRVFRG